MGSGYSENPFNSGGICRPRMKFGEKYELLESLTTGGVETFVANDKVRGERVLVHILECEAQKPNQPTVQWVLEQFRHIAPEPAGLVLETGRYSGTLYAYLVTKMPDEAALQKWVQLYRAQGRDTQDAPAPPAKPTPESESPTADMTAKEPSRVPGSVTQLFREFDAAAKPAASSVPSREPQQPPQPSASVKSAANRSAVPAEPDWNAFAPPISPAKAEPNVNSPASSFSSAFSPRSFPPEAASPPIKEGPNPGEFTNFFQGPFRAEEPLNVPAVSPRQVEPPRKSVGEFTAMFNSPRQEEPSPAAGVAGNESPGAGFTGWFNNPNIASRTSGTAGPPVSSEPSLVEDSSAFPAPRKDSFISPQPASYVSPTPPIVPVPIPPVFSIPPLPTPAIEMHPVTPPSVSPSEGATNAFNHPVREAPPIPPTPPSGPSPYTQVISVKRPAGSAGAQKDAAPSSGPPPSFPPMPSLPAIAPPPMPAAPKMPKIAAPPAPKPPKAGLPEPSVSYWPLILTLTVLFFIAALLVLYFALKH